MTVGEAFVLLEEYKKDIFKVLKIENYIVIINYIKMINYIVMINYIKMMV